MDDKYTPADWRAKLEARQLPGEGEEPWKLGALSSEGYESAAEILAHGFLVLADERPELLDLTAEREADPTGAEAVSNEKLWTAFTERWPDGDRWLGGITGFQFGWAHNIVRYVVGVEPTGNPAIMTIG